MLCCAIAIHVNLKYREVPTCWLESRFILVPGCRNTQDTCVQLTPSKKTQLTNIVTYKKPIVPFLRYCDCGGVQVSLCICLAA